MVGKGDEYWTNRLRNIPPIVQAPRGPRSRSNSSTSPKRRRQPYPPPQPLGDYKTRPFGAELSAGTSNFTAQLLNAPRPSSSFNSNQRGDQTSTEADQSIHRNSSQSMTGASLGSTPGREIFDPVKSAALSNLPGVPARSAQEGPSQSSQSHYPAGSHGGQGCYGSPSLDSRPQSGGPASPLSSHSGQVAPFGSEPSTSYHNNRPQRHPDDWPEGHSNASAASGYGGSRY